MEKHYIEIDYWDLSIRTRSNIVDIGFHLGEVLLKNIKKLKREQYFSKTENDVNNNHIVIR